MLPRRRRAGSNTDGPFVIVEDNSFWSQQESNDIELDDEYLNDLKESDLIIMTARDRTSEFVNTIQTLQGRHIARAVSARDPKKSKAIQSHSEFMLIVKNVGRNIAGTYAKLEKLTLLAKRKSLFDDRSSEIQELTYIIKGDLSSLNEQIAQLQELSKRQRQNGRHLQSHSSSVVLALQSKLASMSTDFKQILEVRTENLKQQKNRRDQFSQGSLPITSVANNSQSLLIQQQQQQQQQQRRQQQNFIQEQDQVSINLDNSLVQQPQHRQQLQLIHDDTDNYLQSRAETMQNIESTIVELGGIFQQLAHMVKEQEEMVERIDTNVQDAEMNIEAAHAQILKYFQSVTSNRWLMIKVFAVLIFFFIFFVIFLA